jgi:hypothetical protein
MAGLTAGIQKAGVTPGDCGLYRRAAQWLASQHNNLHFIP